MGRRQWRSFAVALVLLTALVACSSKKTIIQGSAGGNLPNNGFPKAASAKQVQEEADTNGDWSFFDGSDPGRTDPWVDITQVATFLADLNPEEQEALEDALKCGAPDDQLVVCGPGDTPFASGDLALFQIRLDGDVPLALPSADLQVRYSLFLDAGGDPATKGEASEEAPNISSQGTNLLYQVVFGNPGGADPAPDAAENIELMVVDRRQPEEFIESTARVVFTGPFVTFFVPMTELEGVVGFRMGAFSGDAVDTGDASLANEDVVPGGSGSEEWLLQQLDATMLDAIVAATVSGQ